jgi:transposase
MLKPLEISPLTAEELEALEKVYRTTKEVRLRTRAQIVLLAGEHRMTAPAIAKIVREGDQTVRNWLKRWMAERIEDPKIGPCQGRRRKSVRSIKSNCCPRSGAGLAAWDNLFRCGRGSRLADYMAEQTGIRASYETVRLVRHPLERLC